MIRNAIQAREINEHLSYTVANSILQLLANNSMGDLKRDSILELKDHASGSDFSFLNNIDFSMFSELPKLLLKNIKITVDVKSLSSMVDEALLHSRKQSIIDGLIKAEAPYPLMRSLFNIPSHQFTKMRSAFEIVSKGGHPRALEISECDKVQRLYNKYIEKLMKEAVYQKGDEVWLIAEVILSIYLEIKIPIIHIYPLLDNQCSKHVSFVDFQKNGYPYVGQVVCYSKRGSMTIFRPEQRYLN